MLSRPSGKGRAENALERNSFSSHEVGTRKPEGIPRL